MLNRNFTTWERSMEQNIRIGTLDNSQKAFSTIHPYGCILLRCLNGFASVSINRQPYVLRKGELCVLTSDVFLSFVRTSCHFSADYLYMPDAMFNTVYYQITNMSLWEFLLQNPILQLSALQSEAFDKWKKLIEWTILHTQESIGRGIATNMVCNLFKVIDDQLTNLYDKKEYIAKDSGWAITVRFFALLYKHYKEHRNVEFYAGQMSITADYLNKVVRRKYGVSPKKVINDQLVEDIKFRLIHTTQFVKEISAVLHFEDTSYFCRFFRKQVGVSLVEFRKGH